MTILGVAIEGNLTANGSSGDEREATATSSSSPYMAWKKHATINIVIKSNMTIVTISRLVAMDVIW